MVKANMLAENMKGFIEYVDKKNREKNIYHSNFDKLNRLKLFIKEFQFRVIAEELLRINKFLYDEKYTSILVNNFRKGIQIIGEFIDNNYDDLFFFSARLYTLRSNSACFSKI